MPILHFNKQVSHRTRQRLFGINLPLNKRIDRRRLSQLAWIDRNEKKCSNSNFWLIDCRCRYNYFNVIKMSLCLFILRSSSSMDNYFSDSMWQIFEWLRWWMFSDCQNSVVNSEVSTDWRRYYECEEKGSQQPKISSLWSRCAQGSTAFHSQMCTQTRFFVHVTLRKAEKCFHSHGLMPEVRMEGWMHRTLIRAVSCLWSAHSIHEAAHRYAKARRKFPVLISDLFLPHKIGPTIESITHFLSFPMRVAKHLHSVASKTNSISIRKKKRQIRFGYN